VTAHLYIHASKSSDVRENYMAYTIVGVFESQEQARTVIDDLLRAGVLQQQISFLGAQAAENKDAKILGKDAAAGALVGGVGGLLLGLAALAVPGIGPMLAAGPLATTLIGVGVGATGGALIAALHEMGVPESDAKVYEERVRGGATLVSVTADDTLADPVAEILNQHGAQNVDERRARQYQH